MIKDKVERCKICLEKDRIDLFISPCHCKGSIKFVHPECMLRWRRSLLQLGRENDIYHCQLCKHKLQVKQRRLWANLLHYKIFRIIITTILLGIILIPSGSIMKAFVQFSVAILNYPGGISQAWTNKTLIHLLLNSIKLSIFASFSSSNTSINNNPSAIQVLYSPFPVCSSPPTHDFPLFSNRILYYFLLPFSDKRLWQFFLCRLEHLHLGFFLLGSLNNIVFTFRLLNDMFDIVLLGHDQLDEFELEEEDNQNINFITKKLSKLLKNFLLTYCCSLVILFWIHFNVFAFHSEATHEYSPRQFITELPLWILRWVTLGFAVIDFATRGLYRWLSKIAYSLDGEDVLSLPETKT